MGRRRVQPEGTPTRRSGRLAALPSNSLLPPRTTTIHDLPLETIGRIITIAYPAAPAHKGRKERYRFLKATSLVCREWTPFAQEALWLDVVLLDKTVESFLEAGAGRHPVQNLYVHSLVFKNGSENLVQAVLRDVRGVRDLEWYYCPVSMDWLSGENLKGLKTLDLVEVAASAESTSTLLPFALTTLKLNYREDHPLSFPLINALSRQSSITSLVIETDELDSTALLTRLAPLAPGLDTLDICLGDVPGAADNFLQGCTHLKHLKIRFMPLDIVKHVAASLVSWTIQYMRSDELLELLDVLETGSIATAKLENLVLERSYIIHSSPCWVELVRMCKEKKIKLIERQQ